MTTHGESLSALAGPPYWGDNLSRSEVVWSGHPAPDDVASVVEEWLQHLIVRRLVTRGWTAERLGQVLGGTRSSWQNKLNGHRRLQWADLVKLCLALDVAIFEALPLPTADIRDLVPPAYADRLTHHKADSGLPRFRNPSQPDWEQACSALDLWMTTESERGRVWTLTRDVLVNRALSELGDAGLPSTGGALFGPDSRHSLGIEWPTRDVVLRVVALPADAVKPSAARLRELLREAGDLLWDLGATPSATKAMLLWAPTALRTTFGDALGLGPSDEEFTLVGLEAAHRLRLTDQRDVPDIHIRRRRGAAVDWFFVK